MKVNDVAIEPITTHPPAITPKPLHTQSLDFVISGKCIQSFYKVFSFLCTMRGWIVPHISRSLEEAVEVMGPPSSSHR